uniref:Uncharacterized protein n=1 Tax=Eutreptiella gymnastica TaxID=73025 RepID=A0A7S1JEK6_9EUGL
MILRSTKQTASWLPLLMKGRSLDQSHLQELERRVMEAVEKLSVQEWKVEPPTSQDDPVMMEPIQSTSKFQITESRALRAKCPGTQAPDNKYLVSPSKYVPSERAVEQEARLEHMIHVAAPKGLQFVVNFITEEEEGHLVELASTFDWDHDVSNRDTVQFRYKFDYHS